MLTTVAETLSASGTSLAAQVLAKDYAQSVHTQAKVGVETVMPWHKGYAQDVRSWAKLNSRDFRGMARMYNHGIKRV